MTESASVPRPRVRAAALLLGVSTSLLAACAGDGRPPTATPTARASSSSSAPTPVRSVTASPPAATAPAVPDYGGQEVSWPRISRDAAPAALGAVRTLGRVQRSDGGTLAAGLVLPRVGGSAGRPAVLTPCGTRVVLSGRLEAVPPAAPGEHLVLLDPGHGGRAEGTHSPAGAAEKDLVLDLARRLRSVLAGQPDVGRVLLTRDRDLEATLPFRVALGDALRADLALSIHLNAAPETTQAVPGTSTYGSIADPAGRRAAGVIYAAIRSELERYDAEVGEWAANRDSGALYRRGRDGRDYYGLLRTAHVTWVIAESLYLSAPREAALIAREEVRAGLAAAMGAGVTRYLSGAPGSGWRRPLPRPADPPPPASQGRCADPR